MSEGNSSSTGDSMSDILSSSASMNMSNTSSAHSSSDCSPVYFTTDLFGGSTEANEQNTYGARSDEAHIVLGVILLLLVATWTLYICEYIRIRTAYITSSLLQIVMGTYLLLWVFIFMAPSNLPALYQYSTKDLLQIQHTTIALCLLACGVCELLQAYGQLVTVYWNILWTFCMAMVGLIFVLHPQHSYMANTLHLVLGTTLILAGILFGRGKDISVQNVSLSKQKQVRGRSTRYERVAGEETTRKEEPGDWNIIYAGAFFTIAAGLLISFRENESVGPHRGSTIECEPRAVIVFGGIALAGFTIISCILTAILNTTFCAPFAAAIFPKESDIWCCALLDRWIVGSRNHDDKDESAEIELNELQLHGLNGDSNEYKPDRAISENGHTSAMNGLSSYYGNSSHNSGSNSGSGSAGGGSGGHSTLSHSYPGNGTGNALHDSRSEDERERVSEEMRELELAMTEIENEDERRNALSTHEEELESRVLDDDYDD